MEDAPAPSDSDTYRRLADPALRAALARFVEKRVPPFEVEDIVQATLTEALAARRPPDNGEELRRWVHGIARNKVVDLFRGRSREVPADPSDEIPADSAPQSARDLLRWAERELPRAEHASETLDWMLREGDGEKLESIAREEKIPAARVRQRVTRLRFFFRRRWAKEIALVTSIFGVVLAALWMRHRAHEGSPIAREPAPFPSAPLPGDIRRAALGDCARQNYRACLDGLDRAKVSDPAGDTADAVVAARRSAAEHLAPEAPSARSVTPPAPSDSSPAPAPSPTTMKAQPSPKLRYEGKKSRGFGSSDMSSSDWSTPVPPNAPLSPQQK